VTNPSEKIKPEKIMPGFHWANISNNSKVISDEKILL
jgi:hypothetical protein